MADPSAPTVPAAAGVPPTKPATAAAPGVVRKTSDSSTVARKAQPRWAIVTSGGAVAIAADSFRELDEAKDFNIPRYPLEDGSFESYNKVEMPAEVRLAVTRASDKAAWLKTIDDYSKSLELLSVITPEKTYRRMNLVHYDQHRSAESGAALLTVRLFFQEVRSGATQAFSNVKAPTAANNTNGGAVQTQTPGASQTPQAAPQ